MKDYDLIENELDFFHDWHGPQWRKWAAELVGGMAAVLAIAGFGLILLGLAGLKVL